MSDLEKVELASAHARHALADCGLDGGARNVAVFEYAPLGAAEDGAWGQLLLELSLLAWRGRASVWPRIGRTIKAKGMTDKDYLCRAIVIGWKGHMSAKWGGEGEKEEGQQTLWVANKMSRRARK